jgi:hypothetical protein
MDASIWFVVLEGIIGWMIVSSPFVCHCMRVLLTVDMGFLTFYSCLAE